MVNQTLYDPHAVVFQYDWSGDLPKISMFLGAQQIRVCSLPSWTINAIRQLGCGGASGTGALGSTSIFTKPSLSQASLVLAAAVGDFLVCVVVAVVIRSDQLVFVPPFWVIFRCIVLHHIDVFFIVSSARSVRRRHVQVRRDSWIDGGLSDHSSILPAWC